MQLEDQRYGRNKNTLVNKTYIESGEYRKKFDKVTDNPAVNRVLYAKAKEMLEHRSGTKFEDMYWIDAGSGKIISKELNQTVEEKIIYSDKSKTAISNAKRIIAMHTHPSSLPPSIADFNSACYRGYETSLVICHDGKIYKYASDEIISEKLYDLQIADFIESGYDEKVAQIKALERISESHAIRFEEVE